MNKLEYLLINSNSAKANTIITFQSGHYTVIEHTPHISAQRLIH